MSTIFFILIVFNANIRYMVDSKIACFGGTRILFEFHYKFDIYLPSSIKAILQSFSLNKPTKCGTSIQTEYYYRWYEDSDFTINWWTNTLVNANRSLYVHILTHTFRTCVTSLYMRFINYVSGRSSCTSLSMLTGTATISNFWEGCFW